MNINWHNIRPINGDQKEGFEEFITQLARKELIPNQFKFIRKGKPDAGVECFWILEDNSEWAWQAKYFTSSFGDSQWNQLDESIKTIIEKHTNVVKYFIAIPIDPPDARIDGQKSLLQRWDEHVQKWKDWSNNKIDFVPWWHSDLIERIQKPENSGFLLFWFDKEQFTNDWFKQKIQLSIANLGNRYTPEINFELDIVKIFDGIARDSKYSKQLYEKFDDLLINLKKSIPRYEDSELSKQIEKINHCCNFLSQEYNDIISIDDKEYDFDKLESKVTEVSTIINNIENRIDELIKIVDKEEKERLNHTKYYIRNTYAPIRNFQSFINNTTIKLFNKPYLLLDGEAGIGKSHLLADIANIRIKEDKYSLLLLGQHFNNTESPQKQILDQLDLNCKFEEFLEALNCKAQISGTRIIIFIDAINEGAGKFFWPDYFNGFIINISKFSWLGLVFSIRTSYLKLLDNNINHLSNELIKHTHYGFRNVEYEASKLFFKNYNIELPSVPLLHPEFQNPLFLKLFCDGLDKAGYTKIPDGINGITKIFDFFIDSINIKLSSPKFFNYSSGVNIVEKVIHQLTKYKLINDLYYIPIDIAVKNVSDIQNTYNISGNLTDALISEGILSKNLFWKEKENSEEGIYISYERFEDHLVVSEILDDISSDKIRKEFEDEGALFKFIKDEYAINWHKGIIEALSIQLPEKYSIELYQLLDDKNNYEIAEAFVSSLLWRRNDLEIDEQVIEYINSTVLKFQGTHDYFWDIVIAVSSNPNHFFNGNKTHEILSKYSLSDRDAWWTQLIHYWYNDETSVKRLIDWAWSIEDKRHISDDSIELASIMLSWFLASTNRRLRDSATKALICLLENRIHILKKLLIKFENVNDPYIYERVFAVAYGCTLRTKITGSLPELSQYIYDRIFNKDKVYPHVLLRDYARGVIEYTLHLGFDLPLDITKVRPPYKSDFPPTPTDAEINKYKIDYNSRDSHDHDWSVNSILRSMEIEYTRNGRAAGYGDFGRYVFQSNFYDWDNISPVDLKNIAIKRIFDLGYDSKKHGDFDKMIPYHGRHYHTQERIGKKYQWIAMHELLAQVSDNYKMKASWRNWGEDNTMVDFCGPWEPFLRDIDPSTIQRNNKLAIVNIQPKITYMNWDMDNNQWLNDISDLPEPKIIIEDETKEWVMLEGHYDLNEEKILGNEIYSIPQKQFWYLIKSYFVPSDQYDVIYKWLSDKNFMNRWMPESHNSYEMFNREYYWSPAYNYFKKEYYGGEQISKIYDRENDNEIGDVIVTTESYSWEAEYDLSKEETFRFYKPCSKLVKELRLFYGNNESYMYSDNGELICFDNSEGNSGYPCLFFKKSVLKEFLEKHNFKMIWTVLGEKNIIGGHGRDNYGRWPIVSGIYSMINDEISGNIKLYE